MIGPAESFAGAQMPWGQSETPLRGVLQMMKKNKYKFPASIEYLYPIPAGSDMLTEVEKCVEYCRKALAWHLNLERMKSNE